MCPFCKKNPRQKGELSNHYTRITPENHHLKWGMKIGDKDWYILLLMSYVTLGMQFRIPTLCDWMLMDDGLVELSFVRISLNIIYKCTLDFGPNKVSIEVFFLFYRPTRKPGWNSTCPDMETLNSSSQERRCQVRWTVKSFCPFNKIVVNRL